MRSWVPIRPRGPANGLVLRRGFKIASWGETDQVDFTFSAAKSYLSLLAGIAVMDGLIADLDEPVGRTVDDGGFDSDAEPRRHVAASVAEYVGMGRRAVRQVRRDRSQPQPGGWRARDAKATFGRCGLPARSGNTTTSASIG